MRTYEELIAAQTELMHFNPNHDPKTGRFAKSTTSMGLKNLKRAKTSNLTKWGTSPENNVLYITGYSGSGKSTTALSLARKNDTVIHLDGYSEMHAEIAQNKKFNDYLDKMVPDWKRMANATKDGNDGTMKRHSKEYWNTVDDFRNAIERFGKDEFKKGNRVIVEGVQISDDWLSENKSYYANKPTIIMTTNPITSMKRAFQRDDRGGIISGLKSLDSAKEYIQWYVNSTKRLGDLSKTTQAKRGQKYIDDILSRYGGESI